LVKIGLVNSTKTHTLCVRGRPPVKLTCSFWPKHQQGALAHTLRVRGSLLPN